MAEWIMVGIGALTLIASVVAVLIKVSNALTKNTGAIERLTTVMDKHEDKFAEHDGKIDDLSVRVVAIETIHKIRGCDAQ